MCGIVGIRRLDGAPIDERMLVAARDKMTSRGPDDAGLYIDKTVGLGHRRLSIIDLSEAGRMPMSNEDGTVWAVFNGEIYNFVSLRRELEAAGHTFRSHTDSEVIVHAYEHWGTDCFMRFNGMFAIAIWDAKTRRLVLARDIAGEKPLFYAHAANRCTVFGSTLDAILAVPDIEPALDDEAVRLYLEFGYVPAPRAIIRGVKKVTPGCFVVFDGEREPREHAYWSLVESAIATRRTVDLAQAVDDTHELLRKAVRERLVADVPLGAFLSGGIDSSLVVALMAEAQPDAVRTFTIGFHEQAFDESAHAHRIAKHLGVENTMMVLSAADVLRELPSVAIAFDEPMADYSALPSLAVARLARKHVTVALTGDGADEAFGGYRYYSGTRVFERVVGLVPGAIRRAIARRASLIANPRARRALERASVADAASYFGLSGFYRGATTAALSTIMPSAGRVRAQDRVAEFIRELAPLRPTEGGMLWDATHTLPDAWLTKVDRTTMAFGLEARAPFLDRHVLEYAFQMPLDHRVRGTEKKIVLRSILGRYLPRELYERPKQGFTAPLRSWFRNELAGELRERLSSDRVGAFGVCDPAAVTTLVDAQLSGAADHTQLLWSLFHLDSWYDTHIRQRANTR